MSSRLFQLLVVNFGLAILYAFQRKMAWKIVDKVDNVVLEGRHAKEREHRFRPYPKPRRKNLYYRDITDWE